MTRTAHADLDIQHAKWLLPQPVSKHRDRQAVRQSSLRPDGGSLSLSVCVCVCRMDSDRDAIKERRDDSSRRF